MKIQREKPEFKAVDWVRQVRNKHHKLTHGMTPIPHIALPSDLDHYFAESAAAVKQKTPKL